MRTSRGNFSSRRKSSRTSRETANRPTDRPTDLNQNLRDPYGHGSKSRTPSEHPHPHLNGLNWVVTYPKMVPLVLNHGQLIQSNKLVPFAKSENHSKTTHTKAKQGTTCDCKLGQATDLEGGSKVNLKDALLLNPGPSLGLAI